MNKETMRELRERAEEMISAGIANKDALFAALPVLKVKNAWSKTEEVVAGDC